MVTNSLLKWAFSTPLSNPSRARLFETFSAFSSDFSNEPYSFTNLAAVFFPTPITPGILSDESPMRPK